MSEPYVILGDPSRCRILIIADHASNQLPPDIDLQIAPEHMQDHIAWDIGSMPVAELLVRDYRHAAVCGAYSRLLVDLNRDHDDVAAIPPASDGIAIAGNLLGPEERNGRINRYWRPYHDMIARLLDAHRPALILSLHSFTPSLSSRPEEVRPWEVGILYNEDDRAARLVIPQLQDAGLMVGDQLPYSGKILNATMNRHAEKRAIPYLGVEMRQDLVADAPGQERFAVILGKICQNITESLACNDQS